MPCHGCATKFGLWTRENGCPSCGFSFCSSCLKYKYAVPKLNNKICKICKSCLSILSSNSMDSQHGHKDILPSEPPSDLYLRKLESLEAPPKPPVTVYRTEPRLQTLVKGLNSTDLEIARRLEKLREDRRAAKAIPSEDEIAQRLAILRGEDEQSIFKKPSYAHLVPNKRSGEEQTQDLFTQCKEEVELERKFLKPEDNIAERLNRLRGTGGDNSQKSLMESTKVDVEVITLDEIAHLLAECKMEASESGKQLDLATVVSLEKLRARIVQQNKKKDEDCVSDEDEEEAAAKILSRIQAEVDLEEKFCSGKTSNEEDEIMDTDNNTAELPWCVICNEDAKLRCLGCDRDLFCKSCFQEGHRDDDMKSHSFEVYGKK